MKTLQFKPAGLLLALALIFTLSTGCKKRGCTDVNANNFDLQANKDDGSCSFPVINNNGTNTSGDLTGGGGTASKIVTFTNNSTTIGWDMSINATGGSFQLIIKDANGTVVVDRTLTAGTGAQDASATSSAGVTGTWTVELYLTNFNGTGDYSLQ